MHRVLVFLSPSFEAEIENKMEILSSGRSMRQVVLFSLIFNSFRFECRKHFYFSFHVRDARYGSEWQAILGVCLRLHNYSLIEPLLNNAELAQAHSLVVGADFDFPYLVARTSIEM